MNVGHGGGELGGARRVERHAVGQVLRDLVHRAAPEVLLAQETPVRALLRHPQVLRVARAVELPLVGALRTLQLRAPRRAAFPRQLVRWLLRRSSIVRTRVTERPLVLWTTAQLSNLRVLTTNPESIIIILQTTDLNKVLD